MSAILFYFVLFCFLLGILWLAFLFFLWLRCGDPNMGFPPMVNIEDLHTLDKDHPLVRDLRHAYEKTDENKQDTYC